MLIERYFETLQAKLAEVAADTEPIKKAARICADCLERKGVIHIFDSGHMVNTELIGRAGGLAARSPDTFSLQVNTPAFSRATAPVKDDPYNMAYIEHIFDNGQLGPGDVIFVGSVSGKTPNVVELALQAKAHGLYVIVLTSVEYSSQLEPMHPSGKRLFEIGDLVLDNHAPYGDAMMKVDGLEYSICPASGIDAAVILWAVSAGIVEELLARGITPSVFPSVNRPDGKELVDAVYKGVKEKGY